MARIGSALVVGDLPAYRPPAEPEAFVSTAYAFECWLRTARKGEAVVYHRGSLAADRQDPSRRGRQAKTLADFVYLHSDMDTPHMSECYHVRGWTHGAGLVALSQMRATGGTTVYIARRKGMMD